MIKNNSFLADDVDAIAFTAAFTAPALLCMLGGLALDVTTIARFCSPLNSDGSQE